MEVILGLGFATDYSTNMITLKDIFHHIIHHEHVPFILANAKKAEIGGISHIRTKNRQSCLSEDQLVGQISTYCASLILTGSSKGYFAAREKANRNPFAGDNGVDIIGLNNVDVKSSLMRRSQNPLDYRLLVRPKERHQNWIYVLCLVPKKQPYQCYVVGWAKDDDLPQETYSGPITSLHGAYMIESKNLRKISEL